jgi:hypothetical protein
MTNPTKKDWASWRANPVSKQLLERFEADLKKRQREHNTKEYSNVKECAVNQLCIQTLQTFIKHVFSSDYLVDQPETRSPFQEDKQNE